MLASRENQFVREGKENREHENKPEFLEVKKKKKNNVLIFLFLELDTGNDSLRRLLLIFTALSTAKTRYYLSTIYQFIIVSFLFYNIYVSLE